mmetsp:Transcript_18548/g.39715  ORF Transcript_18548/g.39715 Transcript_18548/m.39715 type:complete len:120 (+) Transcript_18548:98-457(+)
MLVLHKDWNTLAPTLQGRKITMTSLVQRLLQRLSLITISKSFLLGLSSTPASCVLSSSPSSPRASSSAKARTTSEVLVAEQFWEVWTEPVVVKVPGDSAEAARIPVVVTCEEVPDRSMM